MGGKRIKLRSVMFMSLAAILLPSIILRGFLMLMFVPSESMKPMLCGGDVLIGTRYPNSIKRGDVIVFTGHDGTILIKRLIGLPGEYVSIDGTGDVYIEGQMLDEHYVEAKRSGQPQEFQVPLGHFLFLGDNRSFSHDARYWENPFIANENILAKANFKIFPKFSVIEQEEY